MRKAAAAMAHKEQKRQQREVEKKLSQAKKTLREPEEKK